MDIRTLYLHGDGDTTRTTDSPVEGGIVWYDMDIDMDDDPTPALTGLGLPLHILESCLATRRFPETEAFAGGVLLHMPVRQQWNAPRATYLTLLMLAGKVVSLHRAPLPVTVKTAQRLTMGDAPHLGLARDLFLYLLEAVIETNIQNFVEARSHIEELSRTLDETPDAVGVDDILPFKRNVARLTVQHEEQFYCLTALQGIFAGGAPNAQRDPRLRDMLDTQAHLARSADRMEYRLRDMQQHCHYVMQERTEQRLRILTILSSIYMPLTLIAGIYGMNFKAMPELDWEYGYFAVLGLMAATAAGLLWFFRRRGWLG